MAAAGASKASPPKDLRSQSEPSYLSLKYCARARRNGLSTPCNLPAMKRLHGTKSPEGMKQVLPQTNLTAQRAGMAPLLSTWTRNTRALKPTPEMMFLPGMRPISANLLGMCFVKLQQNRHPQDDDFVGVPTKHIPSSQAQAILCALSLRTPVSLRIGSSRGSTPIHISSGSRSSRARAQKRNRALAISQG